jgi:putative hydrolase of the HAD superfamily
MGTMSTAPARGLLLDIGGVILLEGAELVRRRARRYPRVAELVARLDLAGPGDDLWQSMLRLEVTERAYWAQRAELIGDALGERSWVTTDLIRWLYHGPDDDWLNDEVIELMLDVKGAGLRLAALTNDLVDFHGQEWVDRQAWLKHFDVIVDASVSGVLKPDPRAYAAAIELMGLPAAEIVYLDDMPWNVDGGTTAGLQAIEVRYDDRDHAVAEARALLGLAV